MRTSRTPASPIRALGVAVIVATLVAHGPTVNAHSMAILRGSAVVDGQLLSVSFPISLENLHHSVNSKKGAVTAADIRKTVGDWGAVIGNRLVVRDSRGDRIRGAFTVAEPELPQGSDKSKETPVAIINLDFSIPDGTEYVSLQQLADDAPWDHHGVPATIVVHIRAGKLLGQTIQLSRAGNVEVFHLVPALEPVTPIESFVWTDAHRSLRSVANVHERGVQSSIFAPLPLIQTWVPMKRNATEHLTVAEQQTYAAALSKFMRDHDAMSIDGTTVHAGRITVEFLDPREWDPTADRKARRLSVWTTRVRITLDYESSQRPESLQLQWTLFNSAVLVVPVLVAWQDQVQEFELSKFYPHLHWTPK